FFRLAAHKVAPIAALTRFFRLTAPKVAPAAALTRFFRLAAPKVAPAAALTRFFRLTAAMSRICLLPFSLYRHSSSYHVYSLPIGTNKDSPPPPPPPPRNFINSIPAR